MFAVASMHPSIMYLIGSWLVVSEETGPVEALVTDHLNMKVKNYYRTRKTQKVYLILQKNNNSVWKAFGDIKRETDLKKIAIASGLDPLDLVFIRNQGNDWQMKLEKIYLFLKTKKVRSALILTKFYKTRRYRLFFDRLKEKDGINILVQPDNPLYKEKLKLWWKKTTYSNYFLSEYVRMFYHYFKKILLFEFFHS